MKFEEKFGQALVGDRISYETTEIAKLALGECDLCHSFTRWTDTKLNKTACSEECCMALWQQALADNPDFAREHNESSYDAQIKHELEVVSRHTDEIPSKDILIVIRDQLDYVKECIASVREHTQNYRLYLWDNASKDDTKFYLERLLLEMGDDVELIRSEKNMGFIQPNNDLAAWGNGEYIILLNSDTKVFEGWDIAITAHLIENPDIGVVGYLGGLLNEDGMGDGSGYGFQIDYVMGWCLGIRRSTYNQYGLFNKQLTFAYCEDADLSLRLREVGLKSYALHAPLVHHYGNKTIKQVAAEKEVDVQKSFDLNHTYMRLRWGDYLKHSRVRKQ